MTFRTLMIKTHRVLGTLVSIFFVAWFLSAFVMIYHGFPKFSSDEAHRLYPSLPNFSPSDSLLAGMEAMRSHSPEGKPSSLSLSYNPVVGHHLATSGGGEEHWFTLEGKAITPEAPTVEVCHRVAAFWSDKIERIDTLTTLDQWTPFSRLREDLPFYRLNLSQQGREVYLSGRDGHIITEHTRSERVWAWLGAIPHWVYFTWIRENRDLWQNLIIFLSALGSLMTLTGLYIGIDVFVRTRKSKHGMHSPYKRRSYRWHHIMGTLGGIFILAWVFSGLMSLADVPESVNGSPKQNAREALGEQALPLGSYPKNLINQILSRGDVRSLRWSSVGNIPTIKATDSLGQTICYDARTDLPTPLNLEHSQLEQLIGHIYTDHTWQIDRLEEYDGYYISRNGSLPLPVWRIQIEAEDNPYIYVHSQSGMVRTLDRRDRWQMWVYNKPHSLKFTWLVDKPILWQIVCWVLLLVGTVVSVTGVILGVRYLRRSLKPKSKR